MSRSPLSVAGFAFAAVALATPAVAAEFTPESRVVEVTVYRQAALVAREARLTLPPGSHRVILKGIPCVADPDSVRVSGTGSAGIEIGGGEGEGEIHHPAPSPEYRPGGKELEGLDRQQSLVGGRRPAIATLPGFFAGLQATGGAGGARGGPP